VPKIIKVSENLTKLWQKQFCTVFLRHGVDHYSVSTRHRYFYYHSAWKQADTQFTIPQWGEGWVDRGGWLHTLPYLTCGADASLGRHPALRPQHGHPRWLHT